MTRATIDSYMSRGLVTIGPDESVSSARALMKGHCIGHLPVVERGALVGIVGERSIDADAEANGLRVADLMVVDPVVVTPDLSATDVARILQRRNASAAVVATPECLVGIFTEHDALKALADEKPPEPIAPRSDRWGHVIG